MTASNTPDQRIDELLDKLPQDIRENFAAFNRNERRSVQGQLKETVILLDFKAALKSLFETMIDSMWLNKHIPTLNVDGKYMVDVDWLTAELTKGKAEVISKYFGGGE